VGLKSLFLKTSAVNTSTAAFNLLTTILLVRWFGAGVYADFMVDLAYLSLIAILLELVPSNYSIFRVQDDPSMIRGLAALAVVTAFILASVALVSGYFFNLFHANSVWIAPYSGLLAVKRYLDTRLQSTGRLREYFGIDLLGAIIRVLLMAAFFWWAVKPVDAVWASLTCATLLAQLTWFCKNSVERQIFMTSVVDPSVWIPLFKERRAYVPYYMGIAFKRVRDNLVPILASYFFINREALGAFFLAFRGLVFTVGQIRVIEGLLNHRQTLKSVVDLPLIHRAIVAVLGQVICIAASIVLIFASDVEYFDMLTVVILSFALWFYVFSMLERAKAYSGYDTFSINISMVSYSVVEVCLVFLSIALNIRTESVFSLIVVCSEGVSLLSMYIFSKSKKVKECNN